MNGYDTSLRYSTSRSPLNPLIPTINSSVQAGRSATCLYKVAGYERPTASACRRSQNVFTSLPQGRCRGGSEEVGGRGVRSESREQKDYKEENSQLNQSITKQRALVSYS